MNRGFTGRRTAGGPLPPAPRWRSGVAHHAARLLLLLATASVVYLLFPAPRVPDTAVLERGVVAPQDVIAEFEFQIPKADEELLQERSEAAAAVPPVYDYLPAARDSMLAGVRALFSALDSAAALAEPERGAAVQVVLERYRLAPSAGEQGLLLDAAHRRQLRAETEAAVRQLLPRGVLATQRLREAQPAIQVRWADGKERISPVDSLLSAERFYALAAERLGAAGASAGATELQRLVLIRFFLPSLERNDAATQAARARARAAVDPIRATVLRGERIVGAHEQIGALEEERLAAYREALAARGLRPGAEHAGTRTLGAVLYNAAVLALLGLMLLFFRRAIYDEWRAVLVLAVLVVAVTGAAALIARYGLPSELIPVAFATLLAAMLWEGRLALVFALVLAQLLGGQTPFLGVGVPFTAALGGAAAAFAVQVIRRRTRTWLFISVVALAYLGAAVTLGLLRSRTLDDMALAAGWGTINAIVASILAIGFLPLLEAFTRITTDQTLRELSDVNNNRLLKRLSLEAPGTYAHTMSVANLAEAACQAIGCNGLLARVGTYYHDVGKLAKPQFFVENQPRGRNPHDRLKPATSAAIIRAHITEGLRLAQEAKLPPAVRHFIAEHHGTQAISFFLDRAREADPEAQINVNDFAYPGPKPQSKETAILMLADSVESAARVLQDPTPTRIAELVDRIVAGKIATGQLDECPLTLREIDQVKDSLAKVLTGMYHHRIDYPPAPAAPPANGAPRPAAGGDAPTPAAAHHG